jgi:hypothetical protein
MELFREGETRDEAETRARLAWNIDLEPCPFCGAYPVMDEWSVALGEEGEGVEYAVSISCPTTHCPCWSGADPFYETTVELARQKMITNWNTRVPGGATP